MKAPTSSIRPPRDRRYGWYRKYNDFTSHPKWDLVVTLTCVEKCRVLAIVDCLLISANKGRPRGSIADFSLLECASSLRIPPAEVDRVYKALEEIAWIDQEHLSTWDERQPDVEDPTAAERQRRFKAKKRAQRKAERFAMGNGVTPLAVTTRLDTDLSKEEATVTDVKTGQSLTYEQAAPYLKDQRMKQRSLPLPPVAVGSPRGIR